MYFTGKSKGVEYINYAKFKSDKLHNLSKYAKDTLRIKEDGIYKYGGIEHKKDYILPKNSEKLNLIKPFNTELTLLELKKSYNLHNYYYHLNSSQMMAFNYFLPYTNNDFLKADFDKLSKVFSNLINREISIKKLELEKESDLESMYLKNNEDKRLGGDTTFDVFFSCDNNTNISIEIKYTEYGFGKSKGSSNRHQLKFIQCYEKCINENGIENYIDQKYLTVDFFLNNYQLMRNLIHLYRKNQIIMFLYPKGNTKVDEEAKLFKDILINSNALDRVKIVYWEDLIEETIRIFEEDNALLSYYLEFENKYIL